MYYNAISSLTYVSKLAAQVNPTSFSALPNFDSLSQNLQSLLPANFINVNASGTESVANNTVFNNLLSNNLKNLTPTIQSSVATRLNVVKGVTPVYTDQFVNQQSFSNASNTLLQSSQQFSQINASQINDVYSKNTQTSQIGSLNQAMNTEFNALNNLSPKNIRDLRDENIFNERVTASTGNIQNNLTNASTRMTQSQVANSTFTDSGQNNLQQLSSPRFSGDNNQGYDLYVRRTVYWAQGPSTDIDSANLRSSTGRQLSQGTSVAVDPSIIPYLSRIQFPDIGIRFATDTGGAVIAKTASKGTVPVIDVFFLKREDALAFAASTPEYVTVKVFPPTTKYKYVANSAPTYGVA